jgi:hypothetical protein
MAQKSKRGRKPNAFDYKKTAEHCSKQLADTKKALVKAEKALSKAQLTHQDLLSEVARLDMLDRSLKAVNDKTQPPQNIKYVYTYPQWVWNPYYNGTYTIPSQGQWTLTTQPNWVGYNTPNPNGATGVINNGNLQGGSLLTSNGTYQSPTVTCTLANAGDNLTFTNSGNVQTFNTQTTPCGSGDGNGFTLTTGNGDASNLDGSLVVDLTTYEPYEEPKAVGVSEETVELQVT